MEGVLVRYPLGLPASFIAAMSKHTVVYTLVSSTTYENSARSAYQSAGATMTNCKFIRAATDSYWTRDYGPWYVMNENNQMCIVDFPYDRPRANDDAVNAWSGTWITAGFDAYEALLAADTQRGEFSFGHTPTLADVYLIPQVESAHRFKVDLGRWPLICAVDAACAKLDAFRLAAPGLQPDAA